jgi:Holliday junction resolvase
MHVQDNACAGRGENAQISGAPEAEGDTLLEAKSNELLACKAAADSQLKVKDQEILRLKQWAETMQADLAISKAAAARKADLAVRKAAAARRVVEDLAATCIEVNAARFQLKAKDQEILRLKQWAKTMQADLAVSKAAAARKLVENLAATEAAAAETSLVKVQVWEATALVAETEMRLAEVSVSTLNC